jgi:hypothetical protein
MFPAQRPLARALAAHLTPGRATQTGIGLLGILVTLGLSGAVLAGVGTVYVHTQRTATVSTGVAQTRAIDRAVQASYASAANFTLLNQTTALHEGVFPAATLDRNGQPVNPWGGSIQVTGMDVPGAPAGNDQGFAVTYEQVPASVCTKFVANGAAGFYQTTVNGQVVAQRADVHTAAAAALCDSGGPQGVTVQFLQVKARPDGPTPPVLTPCVPAPGQDRQVACPAGQISSVSPYSANGIAQHRDSFCNSPYGASGWTPWVQTGSTCAPICTPPATLVEHPTQPAACLPGRLTPAGAGSFTQTRQRTTTYACPAPTGPYTTAVGTWSAWSPLESAACAPQCVAPAPTTGSQGVTGVCPAGQVTASGSTTFAQTQTRSVTYACPAPTGGYTTNYGPWGAATPAVGSVCAPKCTAPAPVATYEYQWAGVNAGCPAGWSGAHTYQKQQRRTATTTYACPAPQGSATGATAYSGWADTGALQADSNTCAPPAPTGSFRWEVVFSQSNMGHGGQGASYYVCSWGNPGESDIGQPFNPGACAAGNVGQTYNCSTLVPQSHDDLQDDLYMCVGTNYYAWQETGRHSVGYYACGANAPAPAPLPACGAGNAGATTSRTEGGTLTYCGYGTVYHASQDTVNYTCQFNAQTNTGY